MLRKLGIFSLLGSFTTLAIQDTIPGSDQCTWGPSYWCNSIQEANSCATKTYCLEKHWNQPVKVNDQLCDLCTAVMTQAIEVFENNEDQLKAVLIQTCEYISDEETCTNMVEENWDAIKEMIDDELDPEMICSALNMCQQSFEAVSDFQFKLIQGFKTGMQQPGIQMIKPTDDTEHHIKFEPENKPLKFSQSSKICNDCVQFGVDIKHEAESDAQLSKLVHQIDKVCDEIEMKSLCRLVLNKKVIKKIIDKINVIQVCNQVEICTPNDDPVLPDHNSEPCTDCKTIIHDMKNMAKNQFEAFQNVIRHSCDLIPHPVNDMCKQLAEKFAHEAAASLDHANIEECCGDIGLCSKEENSYDFSKIYNWPENQKVQGKYCDYCEMAVEYIQYAVDSDMTADQIKAGLKALCDKLQPSSVASTCESFVDKYWEQIVDDIDMVLNDPEHVCVNLHLCAASNNNIGLGMNIASNGDPIPPECTYGPAYWCKSEENMKKCKAEDYCKQSTDEKVGQKLRYRRSELLGANKCTWGPSYFCASQANADECGVTEKHCVSLGMGWN